MHIEDVISDDSEGEVRDEDSDADHDEIIKGAHEAAQMKRQNQRAVGVVGKSIGGDRFEKMTIDSRTEDESSSLKGDKQ